MSLLEAFRKGRTDRFELLDPADWRRLLDHVCRLDEFELHARFHSAMSDEDLERWARGTQYNDVIVWTVDGEIRASVEIGYRGPRAECAITVERDYRSQSVGRALFRRACRRARTQGATVMAMVTSRGNRELIDMAAHQGWTTTLCYTRSIILPGAEPAVPLWLLRDLARDDDEDTALLGSVWRFLRGGAAPAD